MKIRSLAPLAIACLALVMPRLTTSGGVFGGGVGIPRADCDSKNINHQCSGIDTLGSPCKVLPSSEETTNNALRYYVIGTETQDCSKIYNETCTGKATKPSEDCVH